MGQGPHSATPTNASNSNVLSRNQKADTLQVSSLYLSWIQEFSAVMAGRMPVHFGLGMTHNSGSGEFDHWLDTKDVLAYKIVFGNLFLMPMLGKVNEGDIDKEDDVNDYILHFQYDNKESKLSMGVFYEARVASAGGGNDVPVNVTTPNGTITDGWEGKQLNIFVAREFEQLDFGMEAGFQSGSTGLKTASGSVMSLQGFGIATELKWHPTNSKWKALLKAGIATGDDPDTQDKYEGYIFNRNYEVATLLFNHPMGSFDIFKTSLAGGSSATRRSDAADVDAVSNVMYISPDFTYQMSDTFAVDTRFTYATLQNSNYSGFNADKNVGFEWDLGTSYRPHEHFILGFDFAVLFPGSAFAGGSSGFQKETAYGFGSKAAVSF